MSVIYGPVPSWRLGRSLGIDLLSTRGKTCSFDCVYCQLGRTVNFLTERKEFVPISRLVLDLEPVRSVAADYATFSGLGEPTLAINLGQAIDIVKAIVGLPVAVLTNSSLMSRQDVRQELGRADVVVAKLDASNEKLLCTVNKPKARYSLNEILQGIRRFRSEFSGKLALQMMFVAANKEVAPQMAKIAEQLSPDEVQLNTPLRHCAVKPLTRGDISAIKREFFMVKRVVTVYEASRPEVVPFNVKETLRRRPEQERRVYGS
jgi:wyosine [tRNA(Phe)-imidazoG37] synthetase (radical SAM superfamily)